MTSGGKVTVLCQWSRGIQLLGVKQAVSRQQEVADSTGVHSFIMEKYNYLHSVTAH